MERQRLDRWSLTDRITPSFESDMVLARRAIELASEDLRALPGDHAGDNILALATWELSKELPEALKTLTWTPYHEARYGIPCHAGLFALVRQLWGVSKAVTSHDTFRAGMQTAVTLHFLQIKHGTPWDAHAMPIFRLGAFLAPSWIQIMADRDPTGIGLNYRQSLIAEALGEDILNIISVREKWDLRWAVEKEARRAALIECFKEVFGIL